eukprot:6785399-Prymnesium_polylepis.1
MGRQSAHGAHGRVFGALPRSAGGRALASWERRLQLRSREAGGAVSPAHRAPEGRPAAQSPQRAAAA